MTRLVLETGRITRQKKANLLSPATWEASWSSFGMVLKCCRSRKVPNASAKNGIVIPWYERDHECVKDWEKQQKGSQNQQDIQ
ncbi:Uncharacterised protein [Mycobacteroides abscessus subsp. abscessus]|nr:Uncharacterised protein [Mycobacteroides abscessus subsp. abscessus]